MLRENYSFGVYKQHKRKTLWKWYITRRRLRPGDFAIDEVVLKDGTWSNDSTGVKYFCTEEEAEKYAQEHFGDMFTKV